MEFIKSFSDPEFGFYEKRLCVLVFLYTITNSFPVLQALFSQFIPVHYCDVWDLLHNNANQTWISEMKSNSTWKEALLNLTIPWEQSTLDVLSRSSCYQYNISSIEFLHQGGTWNVSVHPFNYRDNGLIRCEKMFYEGVETSFVTEFNAVCDRSWMRPMCTSLYFAGSIVGGLIGGVVSDRFGRRPVFIVTTLGAAVSVLLSAFSTSFTMYLILLFLSGVTSNVSYVTTALIIFEVMPVRLRSFGYFCTGLGYAVGYLMVSGIAYFVRDWRLYLKLCGGAEFIYVVYFFIIDETPQWLIANNKIEEAKKLIKKIKSMGGRSIDNIEDSPMLKLNENTSLGMWETFKTILKLPKLLIRLAILCLAWLIVVMTYYTIALNLNSLSGNRFINIMFGGIVEICNVTLFCLFVETRGRRDTFIGTMFLCGLGIAVNPFLIASYGQLSVATTMFSKLMVGIAFAVLYVYPGELFPTNLRQTIFGICNMFGRTGGLISPFLIYSSDSGNILGPSLATAGIILLTSSLFFCLPKTKANKLPQSVEDALKLQASVNCCRNNERNTEVKVGCEEGTNLEMEKGKLFETVA